MAESGLVWAAAVGIPILLVAPAIWNGYPLLQWDTGGYLARWYEGYLVPSRSTVFGLYLTFGEGSSFWINLGIQALATLWILQLTLRVLGMSQPRRLLWIGLVLAVSTSLPWLVSMLLTDIFTGLSVLALFLLMLQGGKISRAEKCALFVLVAFSAATHSATLAVLLGLCCLGLVAWSLLRGRISGAGLLLGWLSLVAGAGMLLAANFALSRELAWTPGGYGVTFGRMLQDGIVAQAVVGSDPHLMLTGPITATPAVLKKAGLKLSDIDLVEINEAFAAVVLAWQKETGFDLAKTNVNGGAIALGHPLGCTGARLMTSLLFELERTGGRYGHEVMCCGGGIGTATIIERLN